MYNKKVINYHIWSENIVEKILADIEVHKPDVINIFAAEEHELNLEWSTNHSEPYKSAFIENNIEVNYLFGTSELDYYIDRYHFPEHNINVHIWPTYYLTFTYESMRGNNLFVYPTNKQFKYPIISLNNRPHKHRYVMMDSLAKHDLITGNAISWHNDSSDMYTWKHWKNPRRLTLSDDFPTRLNSYYIPSEWAESFLHVISECSMRNAYISEKTWMPIIGKKLFITHSKHGFYKNLKKLGFQLYDELFDYSFDSIIDDEERCEAIIIQVKHLISNCNFEEVYMQLNNKLVYNSEHALRLATNNTIPDIVKHNDVHYYDFVEKVEKV